jgi:hypothetical protein
MQKILHALVVTGSCVSETIVPSNRHFKSSCHCSNTYTLWVWVDAHATGGCLREKTVPQPCHGKRRFECCVSTQQNSNFKTINTSSWTYWLKRELYVRVWSNDNCHTLNATVLTSFERGWVKTGGCVSARQKMPTLNHPVSAIALTIFDVNSQQHMRQALVSETHAAAIAVLNDCQCHSTYILWRQEEWTAHMMGACTWKNMPQQLPFQFIPRQRITSTYVLQCWKESTSHVTEALTWDKTCSNERCCFALSCQCNIAYILWC